MALVRMFVAIELSEDIRAALGELLIRLKYAGADVKWMEKENIHLTLKFLGDVSEEKIEEIKSVLDETAKTAKPFEINLKNIGVFPTLDFPRVVWAGIGKGEHESKELADKIDEALAKIGFKKEVKQFVAHLTLGRVRTIRKKEALKAKLIAIKIKPQAENLPVISHIALFRSTLTPHGPVYTKLHESKFKG